MTCNNYIPPFPEFDCGGFHYESNIHKITLEFIKDFNTRLEERIINELKKFSVYSADREDFLCFIKDNCTIEINSDTKETCFYMHDQDFKGQKLLIYMWKDNFEMEVKDNEINITYGT